MQESECTIMLQVSASVIILIMITMMMIIIIMITMMMMTMVMTMVMMLNARQSKPVRRATGEESGERAGIADVRERITMIQVTCFLS